MRTGYLDPNFLDTLHWTEVNAPDTDIEGDLPLVVTFGHPEFFMVLRTDDAWGIGFSHEESIGLLKLMAEKLPLDSLGLV